MFVLGIDLGTQGVRALVSSLKGDVVAQADRPLRAGTRSLDEPGRFEQDPLEWRAAILRVLTDVVEQARGKGRAPAEIAALSVTSTSGTLCLADDAGEPVGPAIMYSDTRAVKVSSSRTSSIPSTVLVSAG